MARSGTFNFQDFEKIKNNLEKLNQEQVDLFIDACAKELAARLLAGVGLVERIQVLLLMLIH